MRDAFHPTTLQKITVAQYIMDFGNGKPLDENRPVCPVCGQRMKTVASRTPNTFDHFAHLPGGYCPTKNAGVPYKDFPPAEPDAEAARRMKAYFRNNWKIHFSYLNYLVKGLSKNEFFNVIQLADTTRIWEYARLEPFHIAYIFATLRDFPPETSRKEHGKHIRKYYFRCFFDSSIRRYDELWIDRPRNVKFFRAWYSTGKAQRIPKASDMISSYDCEFDDSYLEKTPNVPRYYIDEIQEWIERRYPFP